MSQDEQPAPLPLEAGTQGVTPERTHDDGCTGTPA